MHVQYGCKTFSGACISKYTSWNEKRIIFSCWDPTDGFINVLIFKLHNHLVYHVPFWIDQPNQIQLVIRIKDAVSVPREIIDIGDGYSLIQYKLFKVWKQVKCTVVKSSTDSLFVGACDYVSFNKSQEGEIYKPNKTVRVSLLKEMISLCGTELVT